MRIVLAADIHFGNLAALDGCGSFTKSYHEAFAREMHDLKPDILVVAGDCAEGMLGAGALNDFLNIYHNPHGASLCIPGNHDLWMASYDSFTYSGKLHRFYGIVEEAGWIPLHDKPFEKNGVVVAGHMCWYDFTSADPSLGWSIEQWDKARWNDYTHMPGLRKHVLEWCDLQMVEFEKQLSAVPDHRRQLLVVTHFVGTHDLMADFESPNQGSAFMGNYNIWPMIEKAKADVYYTGHTHRRKDMLKGKIRCINNGSSYGQGSKRYDVIEVLGD